jgi:hypothetical protein
MLQKRPSIDMHEYIIMPNHVHLLLWMDECRDTGLPCPENKNNHRTPQADVPTMTNEKTTIKLDVPTMTNEKTTIKLDVPTMTNEKTTIKLDVPTMTNENNLPCPNNKNKTKNDETGPSPLQIQPSIITNQTL